MRALCITIGIWQKVLESNQHRATNPFTIFETDKHATCDLLFGGDGTGSNLHGVAPFTGFKPDKHASLARLHNRLREQAFHLRIPAGSPLLLNW